MDCTLNLSDLRELLHDTLSITEEVKEVLSRNCDEATFVLKPWQVKTVVERREYDSACSCKKAVNDGENAEKIIMEIDRAIILAQNLREKVKLDAVPSKKFFAKSSIKNVYSSNPTSVSNHKKISQKNMAKKINIAKTSSGKNSSKDSLLSDKISPNFAMRKSISPNCADDSKQSDAINEIPSKTLLAKIAKSKKGKNFILENKLNVKRIIPPSESQVASSRDPNNSPGTSKKFLPPAASAAELSNLIHKVTQQSIENILVFSSNDNNKTKCLLHEENTCQLIQEHNVTTDVTYALQHFNVPNEIIRALRIYHTFLKTKTNNSNDVNKDKNKKSIDIFLREFETTNTIIRDRSPQESHFINVATELISLFNCTFCENLDRMQFDDIKRTIVESGAALKQYNIENIVTPIIKIPSNDLSLAKGWMANGIWNILCIQHFKSFSEAYNIRYNSKEQLSSLYEATQKFQRTKYMNTLIQIILHDVISTVKSTVDCAEYVRIFKTIFILHQGLNPKVPVLVKTDSSY